MSRWGALDALTRIEMQQFIESLCQERGFTALEGKILGRMPW